MGALVPMLLQLSSMADMGKIPDVSEEKMKIAASAASGCLGRAIEFCSAADNTGSLRFRNLGKKLTETLLFESGADALLFCRSLDLKRNEYDDVFTYALCFLRDYMALKSGSEITLVSVDISDTSEKASRVSVSKLYKLYRLLTEAQRDIVQRNASPNTVMCTLASSAAK